MRHCGVKYSNSLLKCLIFIITTPGFFSAQFNVLVNDLALLLDLFGNSKETKLLICTAILVWCWQRHRNGGLNSGQKSAIIVTDAYKFGMLILVLLRYVKIRAFMYRDASHLWHSFSHNRSKIINIQFLKELICFRHFHNNFWLNFFSCQRLRFYSNASETTGQKEETAHKGGENMQEEKQAQKPEPSSSDADKNTNSTPEMNKSSPGPTAEEVKLKTEKLEGQIKEYKVSDYYCNIKEVSSINHCNFCMHLSVFSSPSRRLEWAIVIAHRPSSVRRRPSVWRKLFTFSTSSPELLDGFWWNLVGMKYSWSLTSVVVFRPDPPGSVLPRNFR